MLLWECWQKRSVCVQDRCIFSLHTSVWLLNMYLRRSLKIWKLARTIITKITPGDLATQNVSEVRGLSYGKDTLRCLTNSLCILITLDILKLKSTSHRLQQRLPGSLCQPVQAPMDSILNYHWMLYTMEYTSPSGSDGPSFKLLGHHL